MLLVVDTNILVAAVKSQDGRAFRLLRDILGGKHQICISEDIMDEYEDVLHRSHLRLDPGKVSFILSWIRLHGIMIEPLPTTQNLVEMKDEDDRPFFDVARCLNARLVTRNYKDYPTDERVTLLEEIYRE